MVVLHRAEGAAGDAVAEEAGAFVFQDLGGEPLADAEVDDLEGDLVVQLQQAGGAGGGDDPLAGGGGGGDVEVEVPGGVEAGLGRRGG